jgi:hypothetical protein
MAEDVICTIKRANVSNPIAANVTIQISKMSPQEAATYQGADPHFAYKCYTTLLPLNNPQLVRFRDHVVDQIIIDPLTGTNRTWLIINEPSMDALTGDWKFAANRMRGV